MYKIKYSEIMNTVYFQYVIMLRLLLLLLLLLLTTTTTNTATTTTTTTTATTTTTTVLLLLLLLLLLILILLIIIIIMIYQVYQFVTSNSAKYVYLSSFSQQLKMGYSESNCEASGEPSRLVGKKDESLALGSLHSGVFSSQYPESSPSTRTQHKPLQEEIVELRWDRRGSARFQRNISRIYEEVEPGDDKALTNELTNCAPKVNIIDSTGSTYLHHAVASVCRKSDWNDSVYYKCINAWMSCEQVKVNMPNKKGYTAIGLAVHKLHKTCVEYMLKHSSADRLHLDYYPADSESTVREIITQRFPDLQPLLPAPLMESLDTSENDKKLLGALQRGDYSIFIETLDSNNPNPSYDEPYHSSLLEIACQMKNRKRFVELLLHSGADPNITNSVTGMPLIHATVRCGNFEVLHLLLEKDTEGICKKDNEQRTVLHWLAQVRERKPSDKSIMEKCFKLLLDKDHVTKMGIDFQDVSGNTALYIALQKGFRDRAELLLSKGADVSVLGNAGPLLLPTNLLILEEILDDCLQSNGELVTSKDLLLRFNTELLTNIVPRIAESQNLRNLLKHPVISTFLFLKWLKVRYIFFIDMAFYVTFLLLLTAYILLSEPHNILNDGGAASNTTDPFSFNDSNIKSDVNDSNFASESNSSSLYSLWVFLMFTLFFLTLREVMQLILQRWDYVQSSENWLEILLIIATFISCSGVVDGMKIKLHFFAVALLLGWFEMFLMLGRLPLLSVQLEMLRTVSVTFLRYMMGYVTLLIAFALSFYILFKGSSEKQNAEMFENPFIPLLKTIVMFTGEFEASDLSFDTLPYTSHLIFLLFVVLVAIVLLNLLNGLAVNDTEVIRKDAETLSLVARAKMISRIETLAYKLPLTKRFAAEMKEVMFVIYPNGKNVIGSAAVLSLLRIISEKTKLCEKETSASLPINP